MKVLFLGVVIVKLRNVEQMFRLLCRMRLLNEHHFSFETINMSTTNAPFFSCGCVLLLYLPFALACAS